MVELVSPGNETMDHKFKPLLYAEAAIPHFWRLEFEPAPRLIISELNGGRHTETITALAGTTTQIHAPFPGCVADRSLEGLGARHHGGL